MSTNKAVSWLNIWKPVGLSMIFGSALAFAACSMPAAPASQPSQSEPTATMAEATATTISSSETTTETGSTTPTEEVTATTEAETATPTEAVTATETVTSTGTTTETGSTSSSSAAMAQPLMMHKDAKLGNILVDAKGMTLYVFDKDTAGKSNCTGDCLVKWPALTTANAQDMVMANGDVTATFGVIEREDGTYQVTANEMPLYYYYEDKAPGDVNGQAVGDVWWVVGADGNKITTQ